MRLYTLFSSSERYSLLSTSELKVLNARLTEQKLPALRTLKNHYALAVDYQTYRLANRSAQLDDTMSIYIAKLVTKVKLQMQEHFFNRKDLILIIGFLAISNLASDTNKMHEGAET